MTQTATETGWGRVTRHRPCVVCGRGDWCGTSPDGTLVCCMRAKSDRPARNGGWLHRIADAPTRPIPRPSVPQAQRPCACAVDWPALLRRFERDTRTAEVERLATTLGVTPGSLLRLGIAWAERHRAWAFPMFNAAHETIGVRLRAQNGQKWAIPGSRNGLFWPDGLAGTGPLLVCEGPTDAAALLGLGYATIGRPSCAGNVEMVVEAVQRLRRRDVVVVSDADGPGIEGAYRLAQALTESGHRPKVMRPVQGKDARASVQAGATRAVVDAAIADARYWRASCG